MGADGHIIIAKREDFDKANPGVEPRDLGEVYSGEFLGQDCIWSYFGDYPEGGNHYISRWAVNDTSGWGYVPYGFRDKSDEEQERILKAADWFEENAETHEVWT